MKKLREWLSESILMIGEAICELGLKLRVYEEEPYDCEYNPDCECDDPFCMEVRLDYWNEEMNRTP